MFITVLTPTYNRSHTLHRVFESIQQQTLKKQNSKYIFEWIIVDDGSIDNTKMLVESWKKNVKWPIHYIYQENRGKAHAIAKGIQVAQGELCLIADSDDAFLPETFETFYNIWQSLSDEEKEKCGGIGVLCQDEYGRRVGCDYPIEGKLISNEEFYFRWKYIGLGETWAALKTKNIRYAFATLPKEAESLHFIPESFFWDRITFELKPYSIFVNKVLRIYYRDNQDYQRLSYDVRKKYGQSFLFESKWFIKNYKFCIMQCPKIYAYHFLKYLYYQMKQFLKGKNG